MRYKEADWRYRDALQYIENPRHIPPDRLTKSLAKHLKVVQGRTVYRSSLDKNRFEWISLAYQIKCDVGSGSARWLIEALSLGGITVEDIAKTVGYEDKAVETYLDCFFDVRDNAIKQRYINSMGSYTCAYDHSMLPAIGWKYIVTHFGLDIFNKYVYQRHLLSSEEMRAIKTDGKNARVIRSWSKSWESMNPTAILGKTDVEELGVMVKEDLAEKDMARKDENSKRATNTGKGEDTLKEVWKYIRIGMVAPDTRLGAREERLVKV
jgi:hypothetical protein